MSNFKSYLLRHPVLSAICLTIGWLVLTIVISGITSSLLNQEFGSSNTLFIAHFLVFVCVFILLWKFDWLKVTGVARLGDYKTWLIVILGTTYFTISSLYSFYGTISFDFSNLKDFLTSLNIIKTNTAVCLNEEILFRGTVLFILVQSWGYTKKGKIGSVILMSGIFALLHVYQVFAYGLSGPSALFVALETFIISVWWASLVLMGRSIWPAFIAHFVVNTVIAIQGISQSIIQPDLHAYYKIFLFSLPLGIIGFWAILRISIN